MPRVGRVGRIGRRGLEDELRTILDRLAALEGNADGGLYPADSASHARTRDILDERAGEEDDGGGHEGVSGTEPGDEDWFLG